MIWPGLARSCTSGPPAISDSLLASARVRPASSAARRRRQSDRPGHPVEHHVTRPRRDLGGRIRSTDQPRHREVAPVVAAALRLGEQRELNVLERGRLGDGDDLDTEVERLLGKQLGSVTARSQSDRTESVGIGANHIDRLCPDRAGRAQDDNVAHRHIVV